MDSNHPYTEYLLLEPGTKCYVPAEVTAVSIDAQHIYYTILIKGLGEKVLDSPRCPELVRDHYTVPCVSHDMIQVDLLSRYPTEMLKKELANREAFRTGFTGYREE